MLALHTQASPSTRPLSILGTGHALPQKIMTSAELDTRLQLAPGTVERLSGVHTRHFARANDTAAKLAAQAAQQAMQAAQLEWDEIDCLVAASGTMDQGMPSNAALIHRELGLSSFGIPAFDINASCLGFITALDVLSWSIAAGQYRRVLVVAADLASYGLDWKILESSTIFGDGAAAAVIGHDTEQHHNPRILASSLATYSEGSSFCEILAGGTRYHPRRTNLPYESLALFRMNGKAVFRLASEHLQNFVDQLLRKAGVHKDEIDWLIPHQASHLALKHATRRLGFPAHKVINIFPDHGNQVAASVPTALDCAIRDGRIQRGDRLLLIGTGAGLNIGGIVLEY